jgi:hypothetical protein
MIPMKFQVIYKQKNKKQKAVFFKIEDATLWEKHIIENGCTNVEIVPIL